jgi:hypothetical protein
MHRRRLIIGGVTAVLAGCMDAEDEDTPEDDSPASGDHREVRIEADTLTREADNRIVENGQVTVVIRLRNIATESTYADVSLQLRARDGADLGSPYTREHGPIDPGASVELRFDVEESDDEIGGYELVVREGDPPAEES